MRETSLAIKVLHTVLTMKANYLKRLRSSSSLGWSQFRVRHNVCDLHSMRKQINSEVICVSMILRKKTDNKNRHNRSRKLGQICLARWERYRAHFLCA